MLGLDAWVSLFGPAYFAYGGFTASVMVVWAISCAALAMWNNRRARLGVSDAPARSWSASLTFFAAVAASYVAAHTAVYVLVRYLTALWLSPA